MSAAAVTGTPTASMIELVDARRGVAWERWRTLTADAPPFLTPEFFALTAPLAGEGEPVVACAWSSDHLIGALPLRRAGHVLHALASDHTPEFDYWGEPGGLDAIWRMLREDRRWSEMVLDRVPAGSVLAARLADVARGGGSPSVARPGARHPCFPLPGFEARMSPKFRTNVQRCARKAGGVAIERIAVPTRADFAQALAIEAMGWKAIAGTSIADDPKVTRFYVALARLFGRRGRASLYFLRIAGERAATLLTIEDARTLYALKIGYDPRHYALGPGHLLVWQVALDAEKRGLEELNFVGRDDEWKRKWTDQAREHASVVVYRRSMRGLATYELREVIKPRLPESMRDLRTPLRGGCQRRDLIGEHTAIERMLGRLDHGLGIRSGVVRLVKRAFDRSPVPERPRLGAPSRFAAGSWVRVREEAAIRATLDEGSRLRGLVFVPTQWDACGRVYRVQKPVLRILDDHGRFRTITRTVLLEGMTCAGHRDERAGCGRSCPLMFRDEWLEEAQPPHREPPSASARRHVRVRGADEIAAGLDLHGRRDGLTFMPEMAQYAARRFAIGQMLDQVFEYDRWVRPRRPIYLLEGLACSGAAVGANGPCDRACALLWHEDWLVVEPPSPPR